MERAFVVGKHHLITKLAALSGLVFALVLGLTGMSAPHIQAAPQSRILMRPSAVRVIRGQPDASGGVWIQTIRVWKTSVPLSKPDAVGNLYATVPLGVNPYLTGGGGGGCSGTTTGYVTLDNNWSYIIGPMYFLSIDFYTQDFWDNCNGTVTNKYEDPQCVAYQGSACTGTTSGVYHDVFCDVSPTIGTCNQDWANVNTYNNWNGQNRVEYMRTWVDMFGDYRYANNVG